MFSIIYEPVHGIIYKNSKKEKRVMRYSEIHKFCDATLNRVLEGLRSFNNDVKYVYIQRDLTNEEVKYLKLFEEEIEVRLKYRNQMRTWEISGRGRRPREGNDEHIDESNGQGNDQGLGANGGIEGVNRNVDGSNRGHPHTYDQLAQQLQTLPAMLAQVSNRGNVGNQNGNVVNENFQENVRNVIVNGNRIEKMESVHDMSGCSIDQKVKYNAGLFMESESWNHAMVGAGHAAFTDRFHKLARLVPHLVTPESRMIERYISGALTDEALRNGSIKKVEERGNIGEPSKDRSGRDDNKRTRTVNAFATTVNPVEDRIRGKDVPPAILPAPGGPCALASNCLEPSDLGFKYEIEIASGQLVEIDKVLRILQPSGKVRRVVWRIDQIRKVFPKNYWITALQKSSFEIEVSPGATAGSNRHLSFWAPSEYRRSFRYNSGNSRHIFHSTISSLGERRFIENFSKIAKSLTILTQKSKTFDWGEEQELAIQNSKDKLCNAPILALPDRPEDFVVYCDASGIGLGCVVADRVFSDNDCEIPLPSSKANVVADALSRKEIAGAGEANGMHGLIRAYLRLSGTSSGHDAIWVIVDRLTKSAALSSAFDEDIYGKVDRLWREERERRLEHESIVLISPQTDGQREPYYSDFGKTALSVSPGLGGSGMFIFRWLIFRINIVIIRVVDVCDLSIVWLESVVRHLCGEVGEGQLIGPELCRLGKVWYAWEERELAPSLLDHVEIIEKVGPVACQLDLPEKLNGIHDTFHVSNLKKCLADPTLKVPLDEIRVDAKLNFVEEPVEILEREFKKFKRSKIAIVKVRWNSKRSPEFT
ncbi:putative reverse transcriptase domain-containing protein [Tanacetum coccineum]